MAIKIEMLRCFCTVAETGNLSDAADRLGRTQSAVSMTLKQLEAHLGRPLFVGERKNRLTDLGAHVLQLGQSQLRQFDSTLETIDMLTRAPQGLLRIAAVPSMAALVFPPLVRHFTDHHPGVKIELRDTDTEQVLDAIGQGWADIGIASSRRPVKGTKVAPLFQDPFGLVMSDHHPLASVSGPITIGDVFRSPFLRNALCDQIQSRRIQDHLARIDVTVHNTHSLLAMVSTGSWGTLLPQAATRLVSSDLRFRTVVDLPETREVFLYQSDTTAWPMLADEAAGIIRSSSAKT